MKPDPEKLRDIGCSTTRILSGMLDEFHNRLVASGKTDTEAARVITRIMQNWVQRAAEEMVAEWQERVSAE